MKSGEVDVNIITTTLFDALYYNTKKSRRFIFLYFILLTNKNFSRLTEIISVKITILLIVGSILLPTL
jgi:hypothetical protein